MEMKISLPEEITEAMTRGVAKGVETSGYIDNVSDVGKLQQVAAADAMTAAASNPGGGGTMGDMMGMGMGLAMANQMAQTMGGSLGGPASAPAAAAPPPLPPTTWRSTDSRQVRSRSNRCEPASRTAR